MSDSGMSLAEEVHISEADVRDLNTVADRYFAAVVEGDVDVLALLLAQDARIWHNVDNHGSSRQENLDAFQAARGFIRDLRYEEVRRSFLPGAFLQQHVIRGRHDNGEEVRCPAIMKI